MTRSKGQGVTLELQLRSQAQHYWAESIERTSVIYGKLLKELEGDPVVLGYFKYLSRVFHDIESKREPSAEDKIELDALREKTEEVISASSRGNLMHSHVSDDVLHTLTSLEQKRPGAINNWILIFDWNTGHFVNWETISRDPVEAYKAYTKSESQYSSDEGFEVVLVGSSDVSMIRKTHSHYFGIDGYDAVLETLDESIVGFSSRKKIDSGSRRILLTLRRKRYWGNKAVSLATLKNHYCQTVTDVEGCLKKLGELDLIVFHSKNGPYSLNQRKKDEIDSYL